MRLANYYNLTFSTGLFLQAFSVIMLVQLYLELQGCTYKCDSFKKNIFPHWSVQTIVLASHGNMLSFVTWEVFLAGLLGVCLLLPADEFSEVWCQELVVQCTAAVCQAAQQCKWVCQSLSGASVLLSVHHCWDGGAGMVGTSP